MKAIQGLEKRMEERLRDWEERHTERGQHLETTPIIPQSEQAANGGIRFKDTPKSSKRGYSTSSRRTQRRATFENTSPRNRRGNSISDYDENASHYYDDHPGRPFINKEDEMTETTRMLRNMQRQLEELNHQKNSYSDSSDDN